MPLMSCEDLNSVWIVKRSLEREQRRLIDLQIMAEPAAAVLDGLPHPKPLASKVENIAGLMIDCQQTIETLANKLAQQKFLLLQRLQSLKLNELQERVLSYHYIACLKFKEIAKLMHFTYDYIHYLHRHGLKAIGLSLDEMKRFKKTVQTV